MLSLLTEQHSTQIMPGEPINLQHMRPGSDPTAPTEAQRQLIANYIDAGAILQGHPVGIFPLHGQPDAQRAAEGARLASHGFSVMPDALSAALQTLQQGMQTCAGGAPARLRSGKQARQATVLHATVPGADLQQECLLSPMMKSPAGAFTSPALLTLSDSLPVSPLAEDASLSRLWHTAARKRYRLYTCDIAISSRMLMLSHVCLLCIYAPLGSIPADSP